MEQQNEQQPLTIRERMLLDLKRKRRREKKKRAKQRKRLLKQQQNEENNNQSRMDQLTPPNRE